MNARVLDADGGRTVALVFDAGEEPMRGLRDFASREGLRSGHFTAIGAFARVTLGYFDWARKDYDRIVIDEQVEVLSLVGDVALEGATPKIHAHVVVGKRDGTAHGGHLIEARVRPTLEVILVQPPGHLRRRYDAVSKLALIDLDHTLAPGDRPTGEFTAPHAGPANSRLAPERGSGSSTIRTGGRSGSSRRRRGKHTL